MTKYQHNPRIINNHCNKDGLLFSIKRSQYILDAYVKLSCISA